jgi:hypothetical protein
MKNSFEIITFAVMMASLWLTLYGLMCSIRLTIDNKLGIAIITTCVCASSFVIFITTLPVAFNILMR